jgi:hypothetical protein
MGQHAAYLMSNVNLLKERGVSNYELIALDTDLPESIAIDRTRSGSLTIRHKGILLHSMYDPVKEAKRFVESQNVQQGDHVLLCGFGLGYHVKELLARIGPEGKLVIFEPNFDVLNAALILVDFKDIFGGRDILFIAGRNEGALAMRLSSFLARDFSAVSEARKKVVIHLPSYQGFPENLNGIKESFDLLLLERRAADVFGNLERENFIKNLDVVLSSPNIDNLQSVFSGKPAIFISAGPSLDITMPHLKEFTDKAYIFTADTSYPFLQSLGIVPDVVFSVDPQLDTIKHFSQCEHENTLLIGLPTMDAMSLKKFSGPKMCILQKGNSVTKAVEGYFQDKGFTFAGGAVSCIALDVIFQFGCEPIIFAGMDYSFPAHKYYSTNTVAMKKWYNDVNRFNTVEMMHYDMIRAHKVRYIDGTRGRKVPTHEILYLYLRQIEEIIGRYRGPAVYNFMSEGARIEGVELLDSPEALREFLPVTIGKKRFDLEPLPVKPEVRDKVLELIAKD